MPRFFIDKLSAVSSQPSAFRFDIIIQPSLRPWPINLTYCHPEHSEGPMHFLPLPRAVGETPALQCDLPALMRSDIVFTTMYQDFHAIDRWTKKKVHCIYQALIVAIATRHADAVDVKFLVDGRPLWIALPLPAWTEYTNCHYRV